MPQDGMPKRDMPYDCMPKYRTVQKFIVPAKIKSDSGINLIFIYNAGTSLQT